MIDAFERPHFSRRSLLAGLATMPSLLLGTRSSGAQTAAESATGRQVQAALRNASGTKLVMLGTGGGKSLSRTI